MNMTPREKTIAKLNKSAAGAEVPFSTHEAKLAGMFTETALELEDVFDEYENNEEDISKENGQA